MAVALASYTARTTVLRKRRLAVEERRWVCHLDEQFMPQHESIRHHANTYGKSLTTSYSSLAMAVGYLRLPHE